jgi:hypothetical protein
MTDFSPRLDESSTVPPAASVALLAIKDDIEVIESVTKALYPDWQPLGNDVHDIRHENGRDTWHGIVAEITNTRTS